MESHGALVGWTHQDLGRRTLIRLESVRTRDAVDERDPDVFRVLMTKNQAAVLGNYLIEVSGLNPRHERRGWFRRLFG
jgi:hypothetical protein